MRELAQRASVALVAIPLVVGLLAVGQFFSVKWLVGWVLIGVAGGCAWEYQRLVTRAGFSLPPWAFVGATSGVVAVRVLASDLGVPALWAAAFGGGLLLLKTPKDAGRAFAWTFGLVYLQLLHFFQRLYERPEGFWWALTVLGLVWLYDSGAYLVGRWQGRHPLAPVLSPAKTWEGVAGGLFAGLVGMTLAGPWLSAFPSPLSLEHRLVLAALVGAAAQVGDLLESGLKRCAGVKDSGRLFLSHGGLLDRVDALLLAFPAAYFYLAYAIGFGGGSR